MAMVACGLLQALHLRLQQDGPGHLSRWQYSTRQTLKAARHAAQGSDTGVVLSVDAVDWQQRLAADLAARLAPASCVVVARTTAQPGESTHDAAARFEKVLDACATSPYARNARRWVLAGERPVLIRGTVSAAWAARAQSAAQCKG